VVTLVAVTGCVSMFGIGGGGGSLGLVCVGSSDDLFICQHFVYNLVVDVLIGSTGGG
jgi:hypothetical protein